MKMRELASEITIDPRKLTDYALDPKSPKGKDKAQMFQRYLGYSKEDYHILLNHFIFPKDSYETRITRCC
jgi:hypothetical protein